MTLKVVRPKARASPKVGTRPREKGKGSCMTLKEKAKTRTPKEKEKAVIPREKEKIATRKERANPRAKE